MNIDETETEIKNKIDNARKHFFKTSHELAQARKHLKKMEFEYSKAEYELSAAQTEMWKFRMVEKSLWQTE